MAAADRAAPLREEEEDETLRAVRARAEEADLGALDPSTGAVLRFLARLLQVRHAVEVGSGGGASGLWLLGGMGRRGTLTTIEPDPEAQALSQQAFAEARRNDRVRAMRGDPAEVLDKLADANYDLMLVHPDWQRPEIVAQAARLLRPGGLLLTVAAGGSDTVLESLVESGPFRVQRLDVGDGLLAALLESDDTR